MKKKFWRHRRRNRPGAGGSIGMAEVAQPSPTATRSGWALSSLVIQPQLSELPYKTPTTTPRSSTSSRTIRCWWSAATP
jgi:tripartite-type tricarboxylate transporter receptor subunit TctC